MYFCIFELVCLYFQVQYMSWSSRSFTFSTACFRSPTCQRSPVLGSLSCPASSAAPSLCTQDQMCVELVHTLQKDNMLSHQPNKTIFHFFNKLFSVSLSIYVEVAGIIAICPILTILSLPEHNQASEAKKEQHPSNHRLPIRRPLVHLSKALLEADAVHCALEAHKAR